MFNNLDGKKVAAAGALVILLALGAYFLFRPGVPKIEDQRLKQIELYRQLLKTDPSNPEYLTKIGMLLKDMGDLDEAIEYFKKALKINPNDYYALNELGHAYALKGDYDNAIKTFELAKKLQPRYPKAYNRLGNVYDDKLDHLKALKEYREAQRIAPKDPESYANIARQQMKRGDKRGAIRTMEKAIKANPREAENYYNLGNLYYKTRDYDRALKNYGKAISLDPGKSRYHAARGESLFWRKGNMDGAIGAYKKALEVNNADARASERLGDIYFSRGDYDNAAKYYHDALQYNSRDKALQKKYADALSRLKKPSTVADSKKGGADGGDGASGKDKSGEGTAKSIAEELKSDLSKSETAPAKSNNVNESAMKWRQLGDQYREAKKYDDAVKAYRKATELDKNDDYSHYWLGRLYAHSRMYDDARKSFHDSILANPKTPIPITRWADIPHG
jgi:tetratricopeptide (TPR) repeat protein